MISLKSTNKGPFTEMLNRRIQSWTKGKRIVIGIHTPEELAWWYWNEFGTASQNEGPGGPGDYYEIPGSGTGATSIFMYNGERHVRKAGVNPVWHPGVHASHAVDQSMPMIEEDLRATVNAAIRYGALDSRTKFHGYLKVWLEFSKDTIADTYSSVLQKNNYHGGPGDEDGGRLRGDKASDVYRRLASVIDIEE